MVAPFIPEEFGFDVRDYSYVKWLPCDGKTWDMDSSPLRKNIIGWVLQKDDNNDEHFYLMIVDKEYKKPDHRIVYHGPITNYCDAMDIFEECEVW